MTPLHQPFVCVYGSLGFRCDDVMIDDVMIDNVLVVDDDAMMTKAGEHEKNHHFPQNVLYS